MSLPKVITPLRKPVALIFSLILLVVLADFTQAQPAAITTSAAEEAVRRQEAIRLLGMRVAEAQDEESRGYLTEAARLYEAALLLENRVGVGHEPVEELLRVARESLIDVRMQLARQAQRRGELAEADIQVSRVLVLNPRYEPGRRLKSDITQAIEQRRGNVPSAELIQRVPELREDRITASTLSHDGKLLFEMGKYDEAEVKLRQALRHDPENRAAYFYLNLIQDRRYLQSSRERQVTSREKMVETEDAWSPHVKRLDLPVPNPDARSPLVHTSRGRQEIMSKLDRIRISEVAFDNLPLHAVLQVLSEESRERDPDRIGLNFIINPRAAQQPAAPQFDAFDPFNQQFGDDFLFDMGPTVDMRSVTVQLDPPLRNLRLIDVLHAIVMVADQPIQYSVEDYAVVFSPGGPDPVQLHTRVFNLDPNTFLQGLEGVISLEIGGMGGGGGGGGFGGGGGGFGGGGGGGGFGGGGGGFGGGGGGGGGVGFAIPRVMVAGGGFGQQGVGGGVGQQVGIGDPGGGLGLGGGGLNFVTRPSMVTTVQDMARAFFLTAGVDLLPPKSMFFNDRTGRLMVRATLEDLEVIGSAIETLNVAPPQVNIEAKFAEITQSDSKALGFDWYLGQFLMAGGAIGGQGGTAPSLQGAPSRANPGGEFPGGFFPGFIPPIDTGIAPSASDQLITGGLIENQSIPAVATITGILTDPQFRVVIRALEERGGVDVLSAPNVTTMSGRQAQVSVQDLRTIVTGVSTGLQGAGGGVGIGGEAGVVGGGGAIGAQIDYPTAQFPFGPVLDVIPYVSADGYTIQMTLIPTITEFLGYDDPREFVPQAQAVGGATVGVPLTAQLPLPMIRLRQVTTSCIVWDGQTVLLGGLISEGTRRIRGKVPVLGDIPFLGRFFRSESTTADKRNLVIFVTPTIIDPAGNRVHAEEDLPFARRDIPMQRPLN